MRTSFAALLFRSDQVSDRALSHGVAVAVAGFDVPAPHLLVASLPGIPGFSAAFYRSGAKGPRHDEDDELDHARDLFEEELPPGLAVRDAAAEEAAARAPRDGDGPVVVFAIVFDEDLPHDDAWRFDPEGYSRCFVREAI